MIGLTKILIPGAGLAALAAATPAATQINPHAFGPAAGMAAERCATAVQYRLSHRTGVRGFGGQVVGGRVVAVTRSVPGRTQIRVTGLAVSDRLAYGPYGVGAYGALGQQYSQTADISFRCYVDYRGQVLRVDLNKR